MGRRVCLAPIVFFCLLAMAEGQVRLETDSVERNYAQELPRIPATAGKDTLAKFQLLDGWQVELVASEPLVTDPTAVAFDEAGRMFVASMRGYSEHGDEALGVIRRLEDSDGDGVFDRGTDYAVELSWPTAIACYDGGLFVAASPSILYLKDTDDDGVADERRVVMTGFARQNVQGLLNSFRWGFDNRIYGAAGLNGGDISLSQSPANTGNSANHKVTLRRTDFAFDPIDVDLQPVSGGAQHGATFDRWGERFVCSNSDHLQWIEFEDQHLQRNPMLSGFSARRSIAQDGAAAEVYRTSQVEPWRIVRTRLRVKGMVGGPVEGGGRASGYFTSASGITIFQGDAFGEKFANDSFAFVGDVGSNLVHLKQIQDKPQELSKTGTRATPARQEFLTSTDNWFRPVQFANAPDGTLYVIDMYRETIEHPLSLPPMIKQHLDLDSGRDRGRIYRISPVGWKHSQRPMPADCEPANLPAMLEHTNGWHRETAARLIATRGSKSAQLKTQFASQLMRLAKSSTHAIARVRSLYLLHSLDSLESSTLLDALRDQHPQVRRHALKLVEAMAKHDDRGNTTANNTTANNTTANNTAAENETWTDAIVQQLHSMVEDPDLAVRYQLTLTAGALDWSHRPPLLVALANQDCSQRKMRFAILSSMGTNRAELLKELISQQDWLANGRSDTPSRGRHQLITDIVRQIGRDRQQFATAYKLLDSLPPDHGGPFKLDLVQSVGVRGPALLRFLGNAGVNKPGTVVSKLIREAATGATDPTLSVRLRSASLAALCLGQFEPIRETVTQLLSVQQPLALRNATVDAMGRFDSVAVAEVLLESLSGLPPEGRRQALDLLVSRTSWCAMLLSSLEDETTSPQHLSARHRQQLLKHRDQEIARRSRSILGAELDRATTAKNLAHVLEKSGRVAEGRTAFFKLCASCHQLENQGSAVGPNLEPLRNRGAEFMLTNIVDPNREVDPRYESYSIIDVRGQTFTGILKSETETAVLLLQADGKTSRIERQDIDELQATGRSLMPEGLERDLTEQGIADVIAFLVQPHMPSQSTAAAGSSPSSQ